MLFYSSEVLKTEIKDELKACKHLFYFALTNYDKFV